MRHKHTTQKPGGRLPSGHLDGYLVHVRSKKMAMMRAGISFERNREWRCNQAVVTE